MKEKNKKSWKKILTHIRKNAIILRTNELYYQITEGGQQFKFSCFPIGSYLESEVAKYLILHGDNHV